MLTAWRAVVAVLVCLFFLQGYFVLWRLFSSDLGLAEQYQGLGRAIDANFQSLSIPEKRLEALNQQIDKTSPIVQEPSPLFHEGTVFPSGNEDGECVGATQQAASSAIAAVVSVTFDRADYLHRHLDSLLGVRDSDVANQADFPMYISQDGPLPNEEVASMAKNFTEKGISYLHHKEEKEPVKLSKRENVVYYRIANHYSFIIRTIFDCFGYKRLIIVEDDMEVAPDFFAYFKATSRLLDADPKLYCVSSWNDHGQKQFVRNETQLHRSDFFPGLGWMMNKQLWDEVRSDWPHSYWDDWMRLNQTRKGRQCIRPEVCRTYNFGAKGASKGQYFRRFLEPIRLSSGNIDWSKQDLSYLQVPRYDEMLLEALHSARRAGSIDEAITFTGQVLVEYDSQEHYETLTGRLGLLREWKEGIPRGSYKGIVTVHYNNATLYLARSPDFKEPEYSTGTTIRTDRNGALIRRRKKQPRPLKGVGL